MSHFSKALTLMKQKEVKERMTDFLIDDEDDGVTCLDWYHQIGDAVFLKIYFANRNSILLQFNLLVRVFHDGKFRFWDASLISIFSPFQLRMHSLCKNFQRKQFSDNSRFHTNKFSDKDLSERLSRRKVLNLTYFDCYGLPFSVLY